MLVRDPQESGELSEHSLGDQWSKQYISPIKVLSQTPPHHSSSPMVCLMTEDELYYPVHHEEGHEPAQESSFSQDFASPFWPSYNFRRPGQGFLCLVLRVSGGGRG